MPHRLDTMRRCEARTTPAPAPIRRICRRSSAAPCRPWAAPRALAGCLDLLTWEEAPYGAVKALLLASGQLRPGRGRGGSVSLAAEAGDEGADGSTSEAAGSFAEAGGSVPEPGGCVAAADGSLAAAALGKASALSAPPRPPARPASDPLGPQPSGKVILPFTVLRRLDCVLEPSNIWILSNRKPAERKGKELGPEHIEEITRLFGNFEQAEHNGKPIN